MIGELKLSKIKFQFIFSDGFVGGTFLYASNLIIWFTDQLLANRFWRVINIQVPENSYATSQCVYSKGLNLHIHLRTRGLKGKTRSYLHEGSQLENTAEDIRSLNKHPLGTKQVQHTVLISGNPEMKKRCPFLKSSCILKQRNNGQLPRHQDLYSRIKNVT